ncbi:MAG: class II aldolase/adducin family protein [Actinomycetota bacterium]
MTFSPTPTTLLPPLTQRQELVLLARALWREGYDDHIAGHITIALGDGTLLCNPWHLTWAEVHPRDVLRIDLQGKVLEGEWPVPPGIPLHLALHARREDVIVAVHHHPRFGTIWADAHRVPPIYDQSSALGGGGLVLVDEYAGAVNDRSNADRAIDAMGAADVALLANHGVFILGNTIRSAHQRPVALEQRCRHAWHVEALGGGHPLSGPPIAIFEQSDGNGFLGFMEAAFRAELRADPEPLSD